jgi:hypothetical protein
MDREETTDKELLGCFELRVNGEEGCTLAFHEASEFASPKMMPMDSLKQTDAIYLIVRTLRDSESVQKGYPLRSSQRIRLGRIEYQVTVVRAGQEGGEYFCSEEALVMEEDPVVAADAVCRICLSHEQCDLDNFFFCMPCACSGSCSLVHFSCLLKWCQIRIEHRSQWGFINRYSLDKFECEICKTGFPRFVVRKGRRHELLPIDGPLDNYLLLSSMGSAEKAFKEIIVISYV